MSEAENVYFNDWKDSRRQGMIDDFAISEADIEGASVLFASYTYEDYNGDALVLFERDGTLYEVSGSHCSCYGLEDQWRPEETSIEAQRQYLKGDRYAAENIHPELTAAIAKLEASDV